MLTTAYPVLDNLIKQFFWLLLPGFVLFAVLLFSNFENRKALLLFSLTLPGVLTWLVTLGVQLFVFSPPSVARRLSGIFLAFPSAWVLPSITAVQLRKLNSPKRDVGLAGYILAGIIVILYLWTAIVARVL